MTRVSLLLGLLITATAGCAGPAEGPVDFEVSGGFGGSGDGTPPLHVERNGVVTRTMQQTTQTATLDPATVADLYHKVDAAHFEQLQPQYTCSCADDYFDNVTVELDGVAHKVRASQLATAPAPLRTVIDTLHDISQLPLDWH